MKVPRPFLVGPVICPAHAGQLQAKVAKKNGCLCSTDATKLTAAGVCKRMMTISRLHCPIHPNIRRNGSHGTDAHTGPLKYDWSKHCIIELYQNGSRGQKIQQSHSALRAECLPIDSAEYTSLPPARKVSITSLEVRTKAKKSRVSMHHAMSRW